MVVEVDCDLCSECKEHADFERDDESGEIMSNCCGVGAYRVDIELDPES